MEFELANFDVTVQYVSHYTRGIIFDGLKFKKSSSFVCLVLILWLFLFYIQIQEELSNMELQVTRIWDMLKHRLPLNDRR